MELIKGTFQDSNASIISMSETMSIDLCLQWLNHMHSELYISREGYTVVRQDRVGS